MILHGFTTVTIALFLLVAGVEVDLSSIWKQGPSAITVGLTGVLVPFGLGFGLAWLLPTGRVLRRQRRRLSTPSSSPPRFP